MTLENSKLRRIYDKILDNTAEIGRLDGNPTKVYWLGPKESRNLSPKEREGTDGGVVGFVGFAALKKDIPQKNKKWPVFLRSNKSKKEKRGVKNDYETEWFDKYENNELKNKVSRGKKRV